MHGRIILIVASDISEFAIRLQEALERAGADSLIVRDPYALNGPQLLTRFKYSAAAVNVQHAALAAALSIPVVLYGGDGVPAHPALIVARLLAVLGQDPPRSPCRQLRVERRTRRDVFPALSNRRRIAPLRRVWSSVFRAGWHREHVSWRV